MKRFIEPLAIMKQHYEEDRLVQGSWISEKDKAGIFRGCFFGCAAQSSNSPINTVCEQWEMPLWLGYLSEKIFEGLTGGHAEEWPVQLLTALVGAPEDFDFEILEAELSIARLKALRDKFPEVTHGIQPVIDCWYYQLKGNKNINWSAARSAARSAAESAAWSAESAAWSASWSAARSAAESAARSALWSAESAARSAAESAAWSAARSAAWSRHYAIEREIILYLINKEKG